MNATSSSDRYAEARAALTEYDTVTAARVQAHPGRLAAALRALITPPATDETPEQIADASMRWFNDRFGRTVASIEGFGTGRQITEMVRHAVHAGIQAALESWEPDDYAPTLCEKCGADA